MKTYGILLFLLMLEIILFIRSVDGNLKVLPQLNCMNLLDYLNICLSGLHCLAVWSDMNWVYYDGVVCDDDDVGCRRSIRSQGPSC